VDDLLPEREARYLVSAAEARTFLALASGRAKLDVFDRERPFSFVRTTYFDSDDHDLFRSQRRRRVRLREYAGAPAPDGIPVLTGVCAFELKESADGLRRKLRATGDRAELMRLLRRGPGRPLDPALARAAAQVRSGWLRPRLTTFYRRLSLTGDGLRVTLDDRLTFCRPVRLGRAGDPAEPTDVVGRGPQLILEIKLDRAGPDWLSEATGDFLAMPRFSKFRDGMLAIACSDAVRGVAPASRDSILSWMGAWGSSQVLSPRSP
jgi:hypothetical protein